MIFPVRRPPANHDIDESLPIYYNLEICFVCVCARTIHIVRRPKAGDPFDMFPKNFWQEFSSPFTDTPDDNELEVTETTTHEPFPFFADPYTSVNVSTQLYSNVYLHCRVNDLQGKTVSKCTIRSKGLNALKTASNGKQKHKSGV